MCHVNAAAKVAAEWNAGVTAFVVTVEIACEDASLNSEEIKKIKSSLEERLSHNIGKDWKSVQQKFDCVQVITNEEID